MSEHTNPNKSAEETFAGNPEASLDRLFSFILSHENDPQSIFLNVGSMPVKFEPKRPATNKDRVQAAMKRFNKDEIAGLDAFNEILNKQPNETQTDEVPVGGGQKAKYVPIEHSETFLDQVFQEWSLENLSYSVEMNEVVVSLEVVVRHPITHDWIRRSGIGAAPIQQEKVYDPEHPRADNKKMRPARVDEFYQTKRLNAMHSAMPAAKAFAFNNAVKSLGERFGRNLNRDNRGLYKSIFTDLVEEDEQDEEEKRAMEYIKMVGPEKARESFSEDFLSKYPQVREKIEEQ